MNFSQNGGGASVVQPFQLAAIAELKRWKFTGHLRRLLETRVFTEDEVQLILRELPTAYRLKKSELEGQ